MLLGKIKKKVSKKTPTSVGRGTLSHLPEDDLQQWRKINTTGHLPGERSGHGMVVIGKKAYLYGGCGEAGQHDVDAAIRQDFYSLDLDARQWHRLAAGGGGGGEGGGGGGGCAPPSGRASFEISLGPAPGTIVVSGGTAPDRLPADMYEYNIYKREWRRVVFERGQEAAEAFLRVYGHSLTAWAGGMVGFGGSNGTEYFNRAVRMDFQRMTCEWIQTTGPAPSERYKHQAFVHEDRLWVLGGGNFRPGPGAADVHALGLHTREWRPVECSGPLPCGRVAHTLAYDPPHEAGGNGGGGHSGPPSLLRAAAAYVWGGFDARLARLDDFHRLDLGTRVWTQVRTAPGPGATPGRRAFHASFLHGAKFWIFGGADGTTRFGDLWSYTLRASPPSLAVLAARAPNLAQLATPVATPADGRSRAGSTFLAGSMDSLASSLAERFSIRSRASSAASAHRATSPGCAGRRGRGRRSRSRLGSGAADSDASGGEGGGGGTPPRPTSPPLRPMAIHIPARTAAGRTGHGGHGGHGALLSSDSGSPGVPTGSLPPRRSPHRPRGGRGRHESEPLQTTPEAATLARLQRSVGSNGPQGRSTRLLTAEAVMEAFTMTYDESDDDEIISISASYKPAGFKASSEANTPGLVARNLLRRLSNASGASSPALRRVAPCSKEPSRRPSLSEGGRGGGAAAPAAGGAAAAAGGLAGVGGLGGFRVPGQGILPLELLNGIQDVGVGVDSFSHGAPSESLPFIAFASTPANNELSPSAGGTMQGEVVPFA